MPATRFSPATHLPKACRQEARRYRISEIFGINPPEHRHRARQDRPSGRGAALPSTGIGHPTEARGQEPRRQRLPE